jgi:hypothetical protein
MDDWSIPESLYMLSVYLTSPEVDNKRRGLNTFDGMRRAKKEGRWVSTAPKGYQYSYTPDGKPLLTPSKDASYIREAFELLSSGMYSTDHALLTLRRKSLKYAKGSFHAMLKNPVYAGYIRVEKYKDEPEQLIKAIHEPLVPKELFDTVQDILAGRRKAKPKTNTIIEHLPLRGFLQCPRCGRTLTGSGSQNRIKQRYYYYHCVPGCKERIPAEMVNQKFLLFLKSLTVPQKILDIYHAILRDVFKQSDGERMSMIQDTTQEMAKVEARIHAADDSFFDQTIDKETYQAAKSRYNTQLAELKAKRTHLELAGINIDSRISYGLCLLRDLPAAYAKASTAVKQKLIGSIFPEKLVFEQGVYKTQRINKFFEILSLKSRELSGPIKKMPNIIFSDVRQGSPSRT